jgi:hypothetical protein
MRIEDAPRDGTWLLIHAFVWAGEIAGVVTNTIGNIGIAKWSEGRSDYPGADWWDEAGGDAYAAWCKPTHWQPLPGAPVA